MEEIHYHHHHHYHHGRGSGHPGEGRPAANQRQAASQGGVSNLYDGLVTEHHQQQQIRRDDVNWATNDQPQHQTINQSTVDAPTGAFDMATYQSADGVEAANSFHSLSSADSLAEMTTYFPNAQTPAASPFRHQQGAQGQAQSTYRTVTNNINTIHAGPYQSVAQPTGYPTLRPTIIRAPSMAQQQQRPARPQQASQGIPSHSSQIEGLSVSQAVVNDVLVDLQSKVINETLQQYQGESARATDLEPLPPIYIRAPQPTIILRSDLNRLRAELNTRVRPPVVYRYPANSNQFQQQQQFQSQRFAAPPQQFTPPDCYAEYRRGAQMNSDEYETTSTGTEHRKEREARSHDQAESAVLNDVNVNDNVHSAFDHQGLSTASFDRHGSLYPSSSFIPHHEEHHHHHQQQQGSEERRSTSLDHMNNEESDKIHSVFSAAARQRQEITFDIDNCITRCFEAHRQRVARRRAARQARRARRFKHTQQPQQRQYQQSYDTTAYQSYPVRPTQTSSSSYFNATRSAAARPNPAYTPSGSYGAPESYDYSSSDQSSSFPGATEHQQYSNVTDSNTHHGHYSSFSHTDAAVPGDTQHVNSDYYQQQQIPSEHRQGQDSYAQSPGTYDYAGESTQAHVPNYNYPNAEQQSFQYPYQLNTADQQTPFNYAANASTAYGSIETEGSQSTLEQPFDYSSQDLHPSNLYQPQAVPAPASQSRGGYSQPAGTFEYTRDSYQSQEPIYNYPNVHQQTSDYSYNLNETQQQDAYNYGSAASSASYAAPGTDTNLGDHGQTYDYGNQVLNAADYYQSQSEPVPLSTSQETYSQPSAAVEYATESYQSQEPIYNYENVDHQSSQYVYKAENNEEGQQGQPVAFDHAAATRTDHHQALSTSEHYRAEPISMPISRAPESQSSGRRITGVSIPTGTVEYTRQAYYSQEPIRDQYATETSLGQQRQATRHVNDHNDRFESESFLQLAGGPTQSSDDRQSMTTITTTPFAVQPHVDTYSSEGAAHSYDLQNYTNESLLSERLQSQQPLFYEEGQQRLLQQTTASEPRHRPSQQREHRSEMESSTYDTYSSLPPLPQSADDLAQQQGSFRTHATDFPPPPTPDRHTYETSQQRSSRSIASIIPSDEQTSIYTGHPSIPPPRTPSDHGTDDDSREDEEIFDLHQCIARCYAKYQDLWNREQQQQYEKQFRGVHPSTSAGNTAVSQRQFEQYQRVSQNPWTNPMSPPNQQFTQQSNNQRSFTGDYNEQQQTHFPTDAIHFTEGATQTRSHDQRTHSNVVQQTSLNFDAQTIEYTPPLTVQTGYSIPATTSSNEWSRHEQQTVHEQVSPVPPRLSSFDEAAHQANTYFPTQITPQPRQDDNASLYKYDEQSQQQRYRAHSEPASIQQEASTAIPPLSTHTTADEQARRSVSNPAMHHHQQQQQQSLSQPSAVRWLDQGRSYETDATFERRVPRIDPKTGLCLVPCPQSVKYAHLPPHLRPELFCVELPPPGALPPVPPPPPPQAPQRWCVRCCCVPGRTLVKKVVYRQVEEGNQQEEESQYDLASVMDQMATRVTVRYGDTIMQEGDAFVSGNYNEQLRVIDFPVYVSGKNDPNLTPLVPVN